jgi:predicted CXXCH cytochrome family protein
MERMRRLSLALLLLAALAPSPARPAGGHDKVTCVGCHGIKNVAFGTSGFCLVCHSSKEQGGRDILPISRHVSHPYGLAEIDPRIARVAPELLRDGRFECLSCHDPHPSNGNFAYLRVAVKAHDMNVFCAACHPSKSDQTPAKVSGKKPGP